MGIKNKYKTDKNMDISYIANLARIDLDGKDVKSLSKDMEKIVSFVNLISELESELENIDDLKYTFDESSGGNVWRDDVEIKHKKVNKLLKNADVVDENDLIVVPKVITEEGNL